MLAIIQSKIFCLPSYIKKPKDKSIQNCNFASYAVWVGNLVSHIGEEHKLWVFENRVLRIFDLKGRKTNRGENCILINFKACTLHRILLG
jgi:hypothetical protein